jgi:hypothetical protein
MVRFLMVICWWICGDCVVNRGAKMALIWALKIFHFFQLYFWPDQFDDGIVSPRTGMGELRVTGFSLPRK